MRSEGRETLHTLSAGRRVVPRAPFRKQWWFGGGNGGAISRVFAVSRGGGGPDMTLAAGLVSPFCSGPGCEGRVAARRNGAPENLAFADCGAGASR